MVCKQSFLQSSIHRQKKIFDNSLILNPVENIPYTDTIDESLSFMHGLYISDKKKNLQKQQESIIQFAGRSRASYDIDKIYSDWAVLLKSGSMSMRLLSGLHAHMIIFMGIGEIGDKVMLLPEEAGGHFATKGILQRLGYQVIDMAIDSVNHCVDIALTKEIIQRENPKIIFIDRSEGLCYEDFTVLLKDVDAYKIFDASQYLTHIIADDYLHPFDMGFDLVVSTIHKNFPGPQRAIVFTKTNDRYWKKVEMAMSAYVSNQHSFHVYSAGLSLLHLDQIRDLSKTILSNSQSLSNELKLLGLPIISTSLECTRTQHIWIALRSETKAFQLFKNLAFLRLNTNYRKLPYGLGYGIRMGTAAASRQGLHADSIKKLAFLISEAYHHRISLNLKHETRTFITSLKD